MRQRHVYPTDQVIHIWAHQSQDSARNGSNVSFNGKLLYSYSTVIAQIEEDKDGNKWAFLSNSSLTPMTGNHVSSSRQATRHMQQFYTPAFGDHWQEYARTPAVMIQEAAQEAQDDLKAAFAPRKRQATKFAAMQTYNNRRESIREVSTAFGIPFDMPEVNTDELAQYAAQVAERRREQRERERERQEKQRQEDAEQFKTWLETGAGRFPSSHRVYHADQITVQGEEVVTSQGAEAPLYHVIKALRFYDLQRNFEGAIDAPMYKPYHTNGHKIPLGHFTLDSIDEHGNVKAGCHYFTAAEIQRFREQWNALLTEEV